MFVRSFVCPSIHSSIHWSHSSLPHVPSPFLSPSIHPFTHLLTHLWFVRSSVSLSVHFLAHYLFYSLVLSFFNYSLVSFIAFICFFIHIFIVSVFFVSTIHINLIFVYVLLKDVSLRIFDFSRKPMHINIGMTRTVAVKGKYFLTPFIRDSPCLELSKHKEMQNTESQYNLHHIPKKQWSLKWIEQQNIPMLAED